MVQVIKIRKYIRVSTDEQADKPHNSLETQNSMEDTAIEQIIEDSSRRGLGVSYEVAGTYIDVESAKDTNRPEFERMVNDIRGTKDAQIVIFTRLDRMFRNTRDFLDFKEFAQTYNCRILCLQVPIDTTTATGDFQATLMAALAELERRQISERVKAKMRWRAEQGLWNGGHVLGYDLKADPEHKCLLVINPEEAKIVIFIFKTYLEVKSLRITARLTNEAGYRTKRYQSQKGIWHGGVEFDKNSVEWILTNPVYIGKVKYNGQLFDGKHEAIIQKDRWDKAKELIERAAPRRNPERERKTRTFLLEGLVYCGKCGGAMAPRYSIPRGEYHFYYQCHNRYKGKLRECDMKSVQAEQLEEIVVERIRSMAADPVLLSAAIQQTAVESSGEVRRLRNSLSQKEERMEAVENEIKNLTAFVARGQVTSDSTKRRIDKEISELEAEKTRLVEQILDLKEQMRIARKKAVDETLTRDSLACFDKAYDALDERDKWRLIQAFIQKVVYSPDQIEIFQYTEPIEPEEVKELLATGVSVNPCSLRREGWLPGLDLNQQPTG